MTITVSISSNSYIHMTITVSISSNSYIHMTITVSISSTSYIHMTIRVSISCNRRTTKNVFEGFFKKIIFQKNNRIYDYYE
jgi:hypothetical protein